MFFSVIIPVYKVEKYLADCIESVLNQTYKDFELILVDDGSPDICPQICDSYKDKYNNIKVIHKENGGLASARRAGIRIAEGEYVFNLDSDDYIEEDTLEYAYKIIKETDCDILSFAYKWVKNSVIIDITNDTLEEGLYNKTEIEKYVYPKLLMDKNMEHISYYLSGKAIKRKLLTPNQLGVSEKISLGEDLCCIVPCYLQAERVYISKKAAYLYSVRADSLSKYFNCNQIYLVEDVIKEIYKTDMKKLPDFEEQVCRYSCFMCFALLAAAAEDDHFESIEKLKNNILNSLHQEKILCAEFENITFKSRICVYLMKKKYYKIAFYFLNLCKNVKKVFKKG